MDKSDFPQKSGWYWVLLDGYECPTPCWFVKAQQSDDDCFIPAGLGDTSRDGIYAEDIDRVGPEIIEPEF